VDERLHPRRAAGSHVLSARIHRSLSAGCTPPPAGLDFAPALGQNGGMGVWRGRTWTCRLGLLILPLGFLLGHLACRPNRAPDPVPAKVSPSEIVYELRGGFAGFNLVLSVRRAAEEAAGAKPPLAEAVVEDRGRIVRAGNLSSSQSSDLERLLAAADLPRLRSQYGQEGAVSDAMEEVVTVSWAGQEPVRVAFVSDPRDEPPAELKALTERLRELALTLPAR